MHVKILAIGILAMLAIGGAVTRADDAPKVDVTTDAKADEKTAWHGDMSFGLSLAKGNANTLLINGGASANKLWGQNELHLGMDGQYGLNNWGKSNEETNVENIHGFTEYKRLFTERFYGSARIDGYHDDIASLHYRVVVGPAVGYYFIKSDTTRLSGEIGPSFVAQDQGSNRMTYIALRISERGEHALSKTSKIWEQVDYLPQIDDFNNYQVNAEAGAEAAINTRLSLRIVATDKFNNEPPNGILRNDITLISSLVYKY